MAFAQGGPPAFPAAPGAPAIEMPSTNAPDADASEPVSPVIDRPSTTPPPMDVPAPGAPVSRRTVIPQVQPRTAPEKLQSFEFAGADLDTVMAMYCEWTDKIYLKNDTLTASISLKADRLTTAECVTVVEAILAMNNIAIVPFGEKFIKVVAVNDYQKQGGPVGLTNNTDNAGTDRLVTQLIQLENVQIRDVQTAVQHLMHPYGNIQTLEGSNSLLVTDTESNIQRIRELVDFIDQATARIEPRFYQITYADATELASMLNEIISMAQQAGQQTTAARTPTATRSVIRAPRTTTTAARTQAAISSSLAGGQNIIQGDVKVMADERTNLILIFSQKENYDFFDKIIKTFDVAVEPTITFEVVNLEYADAEELAGTLNDLVGAAQGNRSQSLGSSSGSSSRSRTSTSRSSSSRSSTSRSSTSRTPSGASGAPGAMITPNAEPADTSNIENLNELSENTKILADIRSNSILLMGQKSDIAAIKNVIASLDVMLEQVVIEAAIFDISLGDDLSHGIDWLYQNSDQSKIGAWNGGALSGSGTNSIVQTVAGSSLRYYQVFTDLDSQALIRLSKQDSDSRIISTPVIMTTDNTEASLKIGEQRPVVTSTDTYASNLGGQRSNYEYKDIGLQLTITPRINPQRYVVMELTQQADQLGEIVEIDQNKVPTIKNREFTASVAVPDKGTVVLGGLVSTESSDTVNKIPILGDIPLIGRYLFSSVSKSEDRRELIVLLTPYVMTNTEEMTGETERLYKNTSLNQEDWKNSWSDSPLRSIPDED